MRRGLPVRPVAGRNAELTRFTRCRLRGRGGMDFPWLPARPDNEA
jgi:hypothetical protein